MAMKPRPLTPTEEELVLWLLTCAPRRAGVEALAPQTAGLMVSGQCDCGRPSIDFRVEGLTATASLVAEADGQSPEGNPVGVLLWARAGRLSGLEVYPLDDAVLVTLPRPAGLHPAATSTAS